MFEGHTGLVAATDNTNINILIDKLPRMLPVNQNIWELAQHTEHKSTPLPILKEKAPITLTPCRTIQPLSLRTFCFFERQHWTLFATPLFGQGCVRSILATCLKTGLSTF